MWTPPINPFIPIAAATTVHRAPVAPPPALDVLMLSGFLLSILTLLIWMHPIQSRHRLLAFAAALVGLAVYGFLQGAWPLGVVAIAWSAATLRRWHQWRPAITRVNSARLKIMFSQFHHENQRSDGQLFEWN
jgi:hypothetical protein